MLSSQDAGLMMLSQRVEKLVGVRVSTRGTHERQSIQTMRTWTLDRYRFLIPLRSFLVGYREGDLLEWDVPAGQLRCRVIEGDKQPQNRRQVGSLECALSSGGAGYPGNPVRLMCQPRPSHDRESRRHPRNTSNASNTRNSA